MKDKVHYIYCITNNINGKMYIGKRSISGTIENDSKYFGSGKMISYAIKKHGIENFTKDILGVVDSDEEAYAVEAILVNHDIVDDPNFYNISLGGCGYQSGHRPTEETKRKSSESKKGKPSGRKGCVLSDEQKKKMSGLRKGILRTEEEKRKISEKMKGTRPSDLALQKAIEANTGKKRTPEQKQRMSDAQRKMSKEVRLQRAASRKGIPLTDERKKQISEKLKGRVFSEETRRKMTESFKETITLRKLKKEGEENAKRD